MRFIRPILCRWHGNLLRGTTEGDTAQVGRCHPWDRCTVLAVSLIDGLMPGCSGEAGGIPALSRNRDHAARCGSRSRG